MSVVRVNAGDLILGDCENTRLRFNCESESADHCGGNFRLVLGIAALLELSRDSLASAVSIASKSCR